METVEFDAAEFLDTKEAQAAFLNEALATGDASYIAKALGVIVRARGVSAIARQTGLTREGLSKGLSEGGDPKLTTILQVLNALDLQFPPVQAGR